MKFFHVYNDQYFQGLEKNGLINRDSGFKIQHVFALPPEMKFNRIAAVGGKLHSFLKENRFPFYVDRIAGGVTYHKYDFDKALIHEYAELLGDWFLGFQLHESASNRKSDWNRLQSVTGGSKGPYDVSVLDQKLKRSYAVTPDGQQLHALSQGSIQEYARLRFAESAEAYVKEYRNLCLTRMDEVDGHILPCDSSYLMIDLYNDIGIRTFMPEVGAQTPMMRKQVSLARGVAKSAGKTWGTYYECWCNLYDPETKITTYSMPCFNQEPGNEWYLTQETHPDDFTSFGENGGSSRILQDRIYHYSLMAGADYMSEEWGLNCSYADMNDFTLSEYGEVKKKFIDFTLSMRGIQPRTPIALVLPKRYTCLQLRDAYGLDDGLPYKYMGYSLRPEDEAYFKHIECITDLLFGRNERYYGNEGHTIANSRFGDVFDLIYEDAPAAVLKQYDYLIDASLDGKFAHKYRNSGLRILKSNDPDVLAAQLERIIPQIMPVFVDKLCWLVSTDENGKRYLSIFNNEGVSRSHALGNVIDRKADRTVTVTFRENTTPRIIKEGYASCDITKKDEHTYAVHVPAATFIIMEF